MEQEFLRPVSIILIIFHNKKLFFAVAFLKVHLLVVSKTSCQKQPYAVLKGKKNCIAFLA
jgi:hypothetical protein